MERFRMESKSRPGTYHLVAIDGDDADCDCEAAAHNRACWHVKAARELMGATADSTWPRSDRELWLSQDIINRLNEPLDHDRITTFASGPQRGIKYLEGHDVIKVANRIFGYGNWGYRLMGQPWVLEEGSQGQKTEQRPDGTPYQVYAAVVELTIAGCEPFVELGTNTRQGTGSASLEMAIKGAVTDGMKRGLKNYGDQFGLVLYDKDNEFWDAPQDERRPNTPPAPETRQQQPPDAPQLPPTPTVSAAEISTLLSNIGITDPAAKVDAVAWATDSAVSAVATQMKMAQAVTLWGIREGITQDVALRLIDRIRSRPQ